MIGMLAGAAGGAVAIGIMEAFSTRAAIPAASNPRHRAAGPDYLLDGDA
jgi:hypothetical protein